MAATNPKMRALIVVLAGVVGILSCAIYVAANSTARSRAEAELAEARAQAASASKNAVDQAGSIEQENADLKKQLDLVKTSLIAQADKLAAAEHEATRLRTELDAAMKQMAEQSRQFADGIKKAEDLTAEARDAERRARLDADALRKTSVVTEIQPPAPEIDVVHVGNDKKHGRKNGKGNGVVATHHGSVASLPRTSPNFSELDTNQDGRLTLEEYKVGFPDVKDVEKEFASLDTNGDGKLSMDEYKAGHPDPAVVRTKKSKKN